MTERIRQYYCSQTGALVFVHSDASGDMDDDSRKVAQSEARALVHRCPRNPNCKCELSWFTDAGKREIQKDFQ